MTSKITFIYQKFYDYYYYSNPDILPYNGNGVYYYYDEINKKSILNYNSIPNKYFQYTIQNTNPTKIYTVTIYIQFLNNNDILFIKL